MTTKDQRFRISFLGAAQTVTGSMHLFEVRDKGFLVDCGLYQGRRADSNARNRNIPRKAVEANDLILTHAHIDHSGNIPNLVKRGFTGRIHCTSATADLCRHMLLDSARIQQHDADWLNRKHEDDPNWKPVEPLYTEEDVENALKQFETHDYDQDFKLSNEVVARLQDAGHVLGSASVQFDVRLGGHRRRVVFSGDIGRRNMPILRDPVPPDKPDYVVMETTYGDRLHAPAEDMQKQLLEVINNASKRKGKIFIPSFSLERTQEIVYALNRLYSRGELGRIDVYIDSPLSVHLTEVFRNHPECFDARAEKFLHEHGDPFAFPYLKTIQSVEESKRLNSMKGPMIIISASGMCEGGRIVHHLRNGIENPDNTVVIVGYQAQHTLGRRIVERRRQVRIFGVMRDLRADVQVLNAFSAHADRKELLWWANEAGSQVRKFFLVHGDPDQALGFQKHLLEQRKKAIIPYDGQTIDLVY